MRSNTAFQMHISPLHQTHEPLALAETAQATGKKKITKVHAAKCT